MLLGIASIPCHAMPCHAGLQASLQRAGQGSGTTSHPWPNLIESTSSPGVLPANHCRCHCHCHCTSLWEPGPLALSLLLHASERQSTASEPGPHLRSTSPPARLAQINQPFSKTSLSTNTAGHLIYHGAMQFSLLPAPCSSSDGTPSHRASSIARGTGASRTKIARIIGHTCVRAHGGGRE
ncbi:hypothetical protein N431DRAFT_155088 [Stipitochalara longipes BDJ]|nr:hypothetical protein N431DRAFT_155088 [Stipitochalara longipes BDJ]